MTGVTLGALLRLTKPEVPSMKQDDENAQQKMEENMDKVVFKFYFYFNNYKNINKYKKIIN